MVAEALTGVSNIGKSALGDLLQAGIISFFDWGFQNIGAYENVNIPTSGVYGGDRHILRPVQTPYYTNGRVWEGYRSNWIWESGFSQPVQPIQISGGAGI